MQITRTSQASGEVNTMDINVTEEQLRAWEAGALIQNAMPHLTDDEREFIMTGITPGEWDAMFGGDTGMDEGDYEDEGDISLAVLYVRML